MRFVYSLFFIILVQSIQGHEDRYSKTAIIRVSEDKFSLEYISSYFTQSKVEIVSTNLFAFAVYFSDSFPKEYLQRLVYDGVILDYCQNRTLAPRTTIPNDTFFSKQTHHLNTISPGQTVPYGLRSVDAWDFRKDITTLQGDTIVIAFIDQGFESSHEDIQYYYNRRDIPDNGEDDDDNGAKDDYLGYNPELDNGNINSSSAYHGMPVIGTAAAKGNNKIGVAGVAWNAQVLPISGLSILSVIRGMDYCINMRRLHQITSGQRGAYIVAINLSIGGEGFRVEDEPLWCDMYDKIGQVGILATCAATNLNADVATKGDLPTLCRKPYMIVSTTLNSTTLGLDGHGYSDQYVDLAAPNNVYTISTNNGYAYAASGTSFTAPQVAGAIALMYSNFSKAFLDSLKSNPKISALKIRSAIVNNVDKTTALTGKVVTGGKLNLFKPVQIAKQLEDSLKPRASVGIVTTGNDPILYYADKKIYISKSNTIPLSIRLHNLLGQVIWDRIIYEKSTAIEINSLPEGLYILTYWNESSQQSLKIDTR